MKKIDSILMEAFYYMTTIIFPVLVVVSFFIQKLVLVAQIVALVLLTLFSINRLTHALNRLFYRPSKEEKEKEMLETVEALKELTKVVEKRVDKNEKGDK